MYERVGKGNEQKRPRIPPHSDNKVTAVRRKQWGASERELRNTFYDWSERNHWSVLNPWSIWGMGLVLVFTDLGVGESLKKASRDLRA